MLKYGGVPRSWWGRGAAVRITSFNNTLKGKAENGNLTRKSHEEEQQPEPGAPPTTHPPTWGRGWWEAGAYVFVGSLTSVIPHIRKRRRSGVKAKMLLRRTRRVPR